MYARMARSSRPTVDTKYAPGPEVLPDKVARPPGKLSGNVDRALPLDVTDHVRHRMLRRDRQQHVAVVGQSMPFFHVTLALPGQTSQYFTQIPAQLPVDRSLPVLRDAHNVLLTGPFGVV